MGKIIVEIETNGKLTAKMIEVFFKSGVMPLPISAKVTELKIKLSEKQGLKSVSEVRDVKIKLPDREMAIKYLLEFNPHEKYADRQAMNAGFCNGVEWILKMKEILNPNLI